MQRASMRAALALMHSNSQDKEAVCKEGIEEIEKSTIKRIYKGIANAPLYNSWGIVYRMSNPIFAMSLYWKGIKGAQDKTTDKANLYNNLSDAYKNLAMKEGLSIVNRERYFKKVFRFLELALENYPEEEEKHIKGAHKKLEDIRKKKEEFDKTREK